MKLICSSNLFYDKNTKENDQKQCMAALVHLKLILEHAKDLISLFRLDSGDGTQDIELSILRAFLNCATTQNLFFPVPLLIFFS
jgi:hypothetical protein